ncbi:subclass B1 metallo-beta-lactamase [Arcticibacter sp.]|uniref:subclass B1 metallo-beta-lactamase n=1 Tax=Arcticibacter sp. TaxID=1872630 RepID=UPI00388E9782
MKTLAMLKYNFIIALMALTIMACSNEGRKQALITERKEAEVETPKNHEEAIYESENLTIRKISNHVYEHTSYLNSEDFGKVPCNGMIVLNHQEAIIFDTPANEESTVELINYFITQRAIKIKAVIATHFHTDCVVGLNTFHQHQIPSFANFKTIELAKSVNSPVPQNGFTNYKEFTIGDYKVIAEFIGEGHTKDNIIGYFPKENMMFGGCLIKEVGSEKGNLEDANIKAWSSTVEKLKTKYPHVTTIIPGHGRTGGPELLDYTIKLFN